MIRKPSPKAVSNAIPSRAEVAAALAVAGLLTTSTAHAWPADPAAGAPPATTATTATASGDPRGDETSTGTDADPGWFPPAASTSTSTETQGLLFVDNPIPGMTLVVDGDLVAADVAQRGVPLSPGRHKVKLGGGSDGAEMGRAFEIAAGQSIHIDASLQLAPNVQPMLGGAPPHEELPAGCCGSSHSPSMAEGPSRTPGSAALAALVIAAFGVRRRKR